MEANKPKQVIMTKNPEDTKKKLTKWDFKKYILKRNLTK